MSTILANHGSLSQTDNLNGDANEPASNYCYLFPALAMAEADKPANANAEYFNNLNRLARLMELERLDTSNSSTLPAIYTYFGQFVNHDLSAPTATPRYFTAIGGAASRSQFQSEIISAGVDVVALMSPERPPNPQWLVENIINQHTDPLCLYSLYGKGPFNSGSEIKALYDLATMKFRLSRTYDDPEIDHPEELKTMAHEDVLRERGVVKIADQRNDGNLIICQLHLAFMLFHNRAIDVLRPYHQNNVELFEATRALVTLHYQYCVLNDYLKHLVPDENAGSKLRNETIGAVPFEFTTAAFRFGHSMISPTYDYNQFFCEGGFSGGTASLGDMFNFTSRGKMAGSSGGPDHLPTHWVIDWNRFFRVTNIEGSGAEHIDLMLPENLASLGDLATVSKMDLGLGSIANRNLKRGYHRFMPSGQEIAATLGFPPLSQEEIVGAFTHHSAKAVLAETGFDNQTPLWVYFLCEAKHAGGNVLGPSAGAIVRGTIKEVLRHNKNSVLNANNGNWTPESSLLQLENKVPIKTIKSFLQFAGVCLVK